MVFKFLRELIDSAKEGIAEGKAELASEAAEREADAANRQSQRTALIDRLKAAPGPELFALQLAAPYRAIFIDDDLVSLVSFEMAPARHDELAKLLERDFGARDTDSTRMTFRLMEALAYGDALVRTAEERGEHPDDFAAFEADVKQLSATFDAFLASGDIPGDRDFAALTTLANRWNQEVTAKAMPHSARWEAQFAHMAAKLGHLSTAAVGLGYLTQADAVGMAGQLLRLSHDLFDGWADYAAAFTAGLKDDPTANFLSRKVLASKADKLLTSEQSPWTVFGWPGTI
ncbi:MAG: DUF1266 domain-containing protein [Novosphingobium sp.]|uniref:DUF1266 domain-containing protein n=1 Tax=Novosphingobium sp. TaxID=1874826 RepID=UPI0032B815A0